MKSGFFMVTNSNTIISSDKDYASGLEATAAARARRLGKTVDQMLVDDRTSLRTSKFPTVDCFRPHEVEQYARGDLSESRIEHGKTCPACAALLEAAQSWERPLEVFLDEVKSRKLARAVDDLRTPLTDALVAGGPVAVAALVTATLVVYRANAIMSISFSPLGWAPAVVLCLGIVITPAAVSVGFILAKWLGFQVSFTQFGGAAIAGLFVLLIALYSGSTIFTVTSNYRSLLSAEDAALSVLAIRTQSGSHESKSIQVPTFTETLAGSVIAQPQIELVSNVQKSPESYEIYWDQERLAGNRHQTRWAANSNKERTNISTAYVGRIEHLPDGRMAVKTSKETIEVSISPDQLSQMDFNEPVVAVVPQNSQEASRVQSVEELAKGAIGGSSTGR